MKINKYGKTDDCDDNPPEKGFDPEYIRKIIKEARKNADSENKRTILKDPYKSHNLKPGEFATFGGGIIRHGKRVDKTPTSNAEKIYPSIPEVKNNTLKIPSKITEADEIVNFLVERIVNTEEPAIRSSLDKFKDELLNEVVENAMDRSDESAEMKSLMYIVQSVKVRRKASSSDSSSSTIPAFTNNILD